MNALLSIKPKYVEAIVSGKKRYEFRKSIFKNRDRGMEKVYMYSTAPVGKIVGSFIVGGIVENHPKQLWSQLKELSGLSDIEFFSYFGVRERGFAIKIEDVDQFQEPIDPKDLIVRFVPPQSFYYVDETFVDLLMRYEKDE